MRSGSGINSFSPVELRELRALETPAGVQRFLDSLPYHLVIPPGRPESLQKKRRIVLKEPSSAPRRYVCWAFRHALGLEAVNDTDSCPRNFQSARLLGRSGKIQLQWRRYREPVYRTLRELAMSYFNIYFNLRSERTLRRYHNRSISRASMTVIG